MQTDVFAAIVGTGFAGLLAAIKLKEMGIDSIVLFEKADAVGGTWRDNTYPGCACDVPSHLYSYSFETSGAWSRAYAPWDEIRAYIERCTDKYDLRRHVRFRTEVVSATWDDDLAIWRVRMADGKVTTARVVVAATGPLSRPSVPSLDGLDRFRGKTFHSAAWDHDYPLEGKSVAVVGTGASAIQFVPHVAARAEKMTLFQRTAPWVMPRVDPIFGPRAREALKNKAIRYAYREWIYWTTEWRAAAFLYEPRILAFAERLAKRNIARGVKDPALRTKLTPTYRMGCKRVLMSNDYYPALARPNVDVVTDAIVRVTEDGVVTKDGAERKVDAIIFGTGFAVHDYLGPVRVIGRAGKSLGDAWKTSAEAYLGTTVAGFPNLFVFAGPNVGLGHNSMIFMFESQVRYMTECIRQMRARGIASVEPREDVQRAFNARMQERLAKTVWQTGNCKSWYQNADGKNTTLWPGFTFEYRLRTRFFDLRDYVVQPHPGLKSGAAKADGILAVKPAPSGRATVS
jgi:cation diffusion facilitator CzcD-associated flavoprotein CzcO